MKKNESSPLKKIDILSSPASNIWDRIKQISLSLVLLCAFYILVTPIGFVIRHFKDPMRRDCFKSRATYRIVRQKELTKNSMEKVY